MDVRSQMLELGQFRRGKQGDVEVGDRSEFGIDESRGRHRRWREERPKAVVVTEVESADRGHYFPVRRVTTGRLDEVEKCLLRAVATSGVERIDEKHAALARPVREHLDDV